MRRRSRQRAHPLRGSSTGSTSGKRACWRRAGRDEHLLLISHSPLQVRDTVLDQRTATTDELGARFSEDRIAFTFPGAEHVHVFGAAAGDGVHSTRDCWRLAVIYPWWRLPAEILQPPQGSGAGLRLPYEGAYQLNLVGLKGDWVKRGLLSVRPLLPGGDFWGAVVVAGNTPT